MICPKCKEGVFTTIGKLSNRVVYKKKYTTVSGSYCIRHRKCNKCGFKDVIAEMPIDKIFKEAELIAGLKELVKNYLRE